MTTSEPISEPSVEARTIRKVALRIVPFLMICYFVSFVDRVNLGFAALDMVNDLSLSPTVFGLGGGIFFLSYFLCEVPSTLLLARIGARRWIARIMVWAGQRSDRTGERVWHAVVPLMLTAVSLASAIVFDSLFAIIVILSLAVIGIYAGKGPVWALSTEWLSAESAAAGLAQINALSNLAGFGTTYAMGFIRDATGSFALALLPLVALSALASVAILWIGRSRTALAVAAGKAAVTPA
jgi:hypothetical protein